jgi:hypothetical protein
MHKGKRKRAGDKVKAVQPKNIFVSFYKCYELISIAKIAEYHEVSYTTSPSCNG